MQLSHPTLSSPIVVDVLRANSAKSVTFDLPFYAQAQLVDFKGKLVKSKTSLAVLGKRNGYQHLWVEGTGKPHEGHIQMSWLKERSFYTLHSLAPEKTAPVMVRLGANDPDFNLLPVQGVVLRAPKAKNASFVNVFETHGVYDSAAEFTLGSEPQIAGVKHINTEGNDLVLLELRNGAELTIAISNNPDASQEHKVAKDGREWSFSGFVEVLHRGNRGNES